MEESDRRIRLIKELRRLLREEGKDDGSKVGRGEEEEGWMTGSRGQGDRTKMAESLVNLYEMEGLWGMIFEAYAIAAREYSIVGEAWMAMKWAELAVEFGAMVLGEGDEEVREMKELARDPWGHGSWRSRKSGGYGEEDEGEDWIEGDERPECFGVEDGSDGEDEDEEGW